MTDRSSLTGLSSREKRELLAKLLRERAAGQSVQETPVSHGQRALWYLHQLSPEGFEYNLGMALRIMSPLDVSALQRTFELIIGRHEVLRSTFPSRDGQPVQRVDAAVTAPFERLPATGLDAAAVRQLLVSAHQRPYELDRHPATRITLFELDHQQHALLIGVHHIACDGWSAGLLLNDLGKVYQALSSGDEVVQSPRTPSYAAYVQWQTEMLASPRGEELFRFWEKQLRGPLKPVDLPTDYRRPAVLTYRGASVPVVLSRELRERLNTLAKSRHVTLFTVLLAAFDVTCFLWSGQEDIVIGVPSAGRGRPEFRRVIGYFVNLLPVRVRMVGSATFRQVLETVGKALTGALTHQDYPFSLLVERLRPPRDPSRSLIVQVEFNMLKMQTLGSMYGSLDHPDVSADMGGLRVRPIQLPEQEGHQELALDLFDSGALIGGHLKFNADLFSAKTAERIVADFVTILESVSRDPGQRVDALLSTASPQPTSRGEVRASVPVRPLSPEEELIASVWEETLDCGEIGPDDTFFELGGDSLGAGQIVARIREYVGCHVSIGELFNHPTVARLATALLRDAQNGPILSRAAALFKTLDRPADEA